MQGPASEKNGEEAGRKHVVLQVEAESLSDTRRLVTLQRLSILAGIAALIFQTVYKVRVGCKCHKILNCDVRHSQQTCIQGPRIKGLPKVRMPYAQPGTSLPGCPDVTSGVHLSVLKL